MDDTIKTSKHNRLRNFVEAVDFQLDLGSVQPWDVRKTLRRIGALAN